MAGICDTNIMSPEWPLKIAYGGVYDRENHQNLFNLKFDLINII